MAFRDDPSHHGMAAEACSWPGLDYAPSSNEPIPRPVGMVRPRTPQ